jgi:hypothetical protein
MPTLVDSGEALAVDISCSNDALTVVLDDGRTVSVPVTWFPRLSNATLKERNHWELIGGGIGIHWEAIDEDISVASLMRPERFMRPAAPVVKPTKRSVPPRRRAVPSPRKGRVTRTG